MNYYNFHAGDYAAHTAHLSWEEDVVYRRLLDVYYLHERAIAPDVAKASRLIRMKDHVDTVQSILEEFFFLADDGWHSKRADEELSKMAEKQEQKQAKDEHEAERMRRYRERRAEMFTALRVAGVVPAWDVSMKELQRLHDENCNAPATHLQRVQVDTCNASATAIPTPTPTPTPTPNIESAAKPTRKRAAHLFPDDFIPNDDGMQKALLKGLDVTAEIDQFRNHHTAKASLMADWQAAWRTWVGNARQSTTPRVSVKVGSDEYMEVHRRSKWFKEAGFDTVWEAANQNCWHYNAHEFRDGKRIEVAA